MQIVSRGQMQRRLFYSGCGPLYALVLLIVKRLSLVDDEQFDRFVTHDFERASSAKPAARKVLTSGRTLNGTRLRKPALPFSHNPGGARRRS
jgi:hypothetical protein